MHKVSVTERSRKKFVALENLLGPGVRSYRGLGEFRSDSQQNSKLQGKEKSTGTPPPVPVLKKPSKMVDGRIRKDLEGMEKRYPKLNDSKNGFAMQPLTGILAPRTVLGQVLYRASVLLRAMDDYCERRMIEDYLYYTPPLHPRRPLDKSIYSKAAPNLNSTRDQILYRGTAPKCKLRHSGTQRQDNYCEQCAEDFHKVPRVLMVNQLWLWVLDGSEYARFSLV